MRTPALTLFLVAAAVSFGVASAQSQDASASSDPEQLLLEQIAAMRASEGPAPASAVEPLRALALLYEEAGQHVAAVTTVEEARYVTRVNQGLTSADEAVLMRQQIRSEKALGNHARVWNLEQEMVTIARQHHDDIRMAPIFHELAVDRADVIDEYQSGGFPPEISLGCYYVGGPRRYDDTRGERRATGEGGGCQSGQSTTVVANAWNESLIYYADAILVLLENGEYASQELRDLEREAFQLAPLISSSRCGTATLSQLVTVHILKTCLNPVTEFADGFAFSNVGGQASLIRLIAYEVLSGATTSTRVSAVVDLADWYLLGWQTDESRARALELYDLAYQQLDDDEARRSLFAPEAPAAFKLPPGRHAGMPDEPYALVPDLFASTATEFARYIDVSFDVTKYGEAERVEILDTGRGATRAEGRELLRLIGDLGFRPRFVDGKLADSARVVARYPLDR